MEILKSSGSLRFKLMVAIAGFVVVACLSLAFQTVWWGARQQENTRTQYFLDSRDLSQKVANSFADMYQKIKLLADHSAFKGKYPGPMNRTLNDFVLYHDFAAFAIFTDINGKYVASNDRTPVNRRFNVRLLWQENVNNEPWFKKTLAGETRTDDMLELDGLYMEGPLQDRLSQLVYSETPNGYRFSSIVRDSDQKPIGVIMVHTNFNWALNQFKSQYPLSTFKNEKADEDYSLSNSVLSFALLSRNAEPLSQWSVQKPKASFSAGGFESKFLEEISTGLSGKRGVTINKDQHMHHFLAIPSRILTQMGVALYSKFDPPRSGSPMMSRTVLLIFLVGLMGWFVARLLQQAFLQTEEMVKESFSASQMQRRQLEKSNQSCQVIAKKETELADNLRWSRESGEHIENQVRSISALAKSCVEEFEMALGKAMEGANVMDKVLEAMGAIGQANQELQNINVIIGNITEKTSVIHDIVFKTQLLSFNASIEASRAGPHGRGFAIVAEEVGKLSQLSGAAAEEIEEHLLDSRQKVVDIIRITHMAVEQGQEVSHQANQQFEDMQRMLDSLHKKVSDISWQTDEQHSSLQNVKQKLETMSATLKSYQQAFEKLQAHNAQFKKTWFQLRQTAEQTAEEFGFRPFVVSAENKAVAKQNEPVSASKIEGVRKAG